MLGLVRADLDDGVFGVWPDNIPAINVLVAMMTQWRMGPGGPIGMDYNVLPSVFRLQRVRREIWPSVFDDVRTVESVALQAMNEEK